MAVLISQTDVREADMHSSVYEAIGRDDVALKAFEEYVLTNDYDSCHDVLQYSLRLLSDDPVDLVGSPLDALCNHLERLLAYQPGERDAVYLHHFIGIEWPDKQVSTKYIIIIGDKPPLATIAQILSVCLSVISSDLGLIFLFIWGKVKNITVW